MIKVVKLHKFLSLLYEHGTIQTINKPTRVIRLKRPQQLIKFLKISLYKYQL